MEIKAFFICIILVISTSARPEETYDDYDDYDEYIEPSDCEPTFQKYNFR